jgi:hypothetical protein
MFIDFRIPYDGAEALDYLDAVGVNSKAGRKGFILFTNGKADVTSSFLFRTIKGYSWFANMFQAGS